MTGKKIVHTSDFDYENVVKRIRQAEQKRPRKPATSVVALRADPRARQSRPPIAQQERPGIWTRMTGAVRDESKQLTLAAVVLLGFGGWMVSSAQALYAEREQAQLAGACHENQLAHAGATYCFDERHMVHTLNADGTTTKAAIDWRVNELSHRVTEAAAAREAREARERNAQ